MVAIIAIILISTAISLPLIILKNRIGNHLSLIVKIMAVTLFALALIRCYLNDNFLYVINGGTFEDVYYKNPDYLQSILRWFMVFAFAVYPCAAFFNIKIFKNFAIYFCLPASIVSLIFYNDFIGYFITSSGHAFFAPEWFRQVEFSLELIIMITLPLLLRFAMGHRFDVKNKREWRDFCIFLPLSLLVCVPVYLTQSLFGFSGFFMDMLSLPHIAWILTIFALLLFVYVLFRHSTKEVKYAVCVFLALYLVYHYNSLYLMGLNLRRLPLQLCNLASYLVLVALIIRKRPLNDFLFIANMPGSLIAIIATDVSNDVLSFWNIHYYIEHTWVFIIPLLMVLFHVCEAPDKKSIKYFFIGLTIYYFICLISGVILNCFVYQEGSAILNEVNYFYLFNDTVVGILPFLAFSREVAVTFNGYTMYPVYMVLVYVLFSGFCMVFMGIYNLIRKLSKIIKAKNDSNLKVSQNASS